MAAIGVPRPSSTQATIRTPLFILGVSLALVAFLVMFAFGLLFANRAGGGSQIRVVVAKEDIGARTPITLDMIETTSWPSNGAPAKVLTAASQVSGLSALVDIPKGQPITANVVASSPDLLTPSSFLPIPDGYVAMTIPASELQAVAGYVAEGDYIDILGSVNTQLLEPGIQHPATVDRQIFTNVYVVRVGAQSIVARQGQTQGVASSITILMTPCDAQFLDWFLLNGELKYVLVSYKNYGVAKTTADQACPSGTLGGKIGPAQIQARWGFLSN